MMVELKHQWERSVGVSRGVLPAVLIVALLAVAGCSWTDSLLQIAEGAPPATEPLVKENGLSHSLVKEMLEPAAFSSLAADVAQKLNSSARRALETAPDGVARYGATVTGDVRWSITPLDTRASSGSICRSFTNETIIRGTRYIGSALACRKISGAWEIRSD